MDEESNESTAADDVTGVGRDKSDEDEVDGVKQPRSRLQTLQWNVI